MYVYKITNKINKKIYIGITVRSLSERFYEHYYHREKRKHLHLYAAMIKYGIESFSIEQIDFGKNQKELFEKEMYWIKTLKSDESDIGYNNTQGGEGFEALNINENLMLELYEKTRSSVLVARELNCSENTILRRLKKYNIKTDRGVSNITQEVIRMYTNPFTIQDICQELDLCNKTIMKILNDNNIQRHTFYKSVPEMELIIKDYNLGLGIMDLERKYKIPRHRLSKLINYKLKI